MSAGFAVFMIFTFTLYFLVYGRELIDRAAPTCCQRATGSR